MRVICIIPFLLASAWANFFSLFDIIGWLPFISEDQIGLDYDKSASKFSDVHFSSTTPRYWIPMIREDEDGELKYSFQGSLEKPSVLPHKWIPIHKYFVNISEESSSVNSKMDDNINRSYLYYPDPLRPLLEKRSPSFLKLLNLGDKTLIEKAKTFFIPVEESFDNLNDEDIQQLSIKNPQNVLYHLSPDSINYKNLLQTDILLKTFYSGNEYLRVNRNNKLNLTHINGVKILESIEFPEGVFVHILEGLLYPVILDDIRQTLINDGRFTNILRVNQLIKVNLSEDNMTVFAPTDKAFSELPPGTMQDLFTWKIFSSALRKISGRYFTRGASLMSIDLINHDGPIPTSPEVKFTKKNGKIMLNNKATIIEKDIFATNGIIQVINKVVF